MDGMIRSRKKHFYRTVVVVQADLDTILQFLVDAETAQRGYTITGDEKFLAPLANVTNGLPLRFKHLIQVAKQDGAMIQRVSDLHAMAQLSLDHQQRVIAARQSENPQAAADLVRAGQGRQLMDRIRVQVASVRGMRSDLISDQGGIARAQLLRASLTSLVAGGLGVGAGLFAFRLSRVMLLQQARERELVEARLEAERSSREKTVFLANMSHEIRTPMNAILGFSELLGEELQTPKHRQYLQSIRTSASSLLTLINDILDMSKIEAGVMELRLEPTDPREICDFLHTVFSQPAAKKGVKLECQAAEDLPRALLLDRIWLRQVLLIGRRPTSPRPASRTGSRGTPQPRPWCCRRPDRSSS